MILELKMCLETIKVKSVELTGSCQIRCNGTIHGAYLHRGSSRRKLLDHLTRLLNEVVTCARFSCCRASIKDMDEAGALMLLLENKLAAQAGLQDGEVVDGVELKQRLEMHLGERES